MIIAYTIRNTAMPTPSLNRDSPEILISSDLGTCEVFRIPRNGDRIGRADERAEHETVDEGERQADEPEHPIAQDADDDGGGDNDPDGR